MNSLSTQQGWKSAVFWSTRNSVRVGVWVGLVIVLAACGVLQPRDPQEVLKERAQAKWDALVKSDLEAAYSYLSPASRSLWTLNNYKNQIKAGFWKSAVVEKMICQAPDSCDVIVAIEYDFQGRRTKTSLKETWIREESTWWFVYR